MAAERDLADTAFGKGHAMPFELSRHNLQRSDRLRGGIGQAMEQRVALLHDGESKAIGRSGMALMNPAVTRRNGPPRPRIAARRIRAS